MQEKSYVYTFVIHGVSYRVDWNPEKSDELKRIRGVSFEEIVQDPIVAAIEHPTRPNQRIILFLRDNYIWATPYVINNGVIFLKTLFASRKYTQMWLRGEIDETKADAFN
jgi:hypothetical protein